MYSLPLKNGTIRKGVIIWFRGPHGEIGIGEAAPLPGWSRETLEQVLHALENETELETLASAQFAKEMAVGNATGWQDLPPAAEKIPLAALINTVPERWDESICDVVARGAKVVKLKINAQTAHSLPELMQKLSGKLGNLPRFRFDANRTLEFREALELANRLSDLLPAEKIEFFEEPLREAARLPEFIHKTPLPVALDETLREIPPEQLEKYSGAAALVFKPTLMGGWAACAPYATSGSLLRMQPVISACFESGIGTAALAELALRVAPCVAAGLDTYGMLCRDLLRQGLHFQNFEIYAAQLPALSTLPDESILD